MPNLPGNGIAATLDILNQIILPGLHQQLLEDEEANTSNLLNQMLASPARYVYSEVFDPSTQVKLGMTVLDVPPQSIQIDERRELDELPMLRTRGSALAKSGRGQLVIEMKATFPDLGAINGDPSIPGAGGLREIIAQFRSSPFLTMENEFVTAVLFGLADRDGSPTGSNNANNITQAKADLKANLSQVVTDTRERAGRLFAGFEPFATEVGAANSSAERIQLALASKSASDVSRLIRKHSNLLDNPLRNKTEDFIDIRTILQQLDVESRMFVDLTKLTSDETRAADAAGMLSKLPIPVILDSIVIENTPKRVNSLDATIRLLYYNFTPISTFYSYMDSDGASVVDVGESALFRAHIDALLARDKYIPPDRATTRYNNFVGRVTDGPGQTHLRLVYPTPNWASDPGTGESGGHRVVQDNLALAKEVGLTSFVSTSRTQWDANKNRTTQVPLIRGATLGPEEAIDENDDFIDLDLAGVTAVLRNRIAAQPVLSSPYHTAQYLGAENTRFYVTFKITADSAKEHDQRLSRLHQIKRDVESVMLTGTNRSRRNARMYIEHDVAKLVGVAQVHLSNISTRTVPEEVYSSLVTMEFVEFSITQESREQVINVRADIGGKGVAKMAVRRAMELIRSNNTDAQRRAFLVAMLYGSGDAQNLDEVEGIFRSDLLADFLRDRFGQDRLDDMVFGSMRQVKDRHRTQSLHLFRYLGQQLLIRYRLLAVSEASLRKARTTGIIGSDPGLTSRYDVLFGLGQWRSRVHQQDWVASLGQEGRRLQVPEGVTVSFRAGEEAIISFDSYGDEATDSLIRIALAERNLTGSTERNIQMLHQFLLEQDTRVYGKQYEATLYTPDRDPAYPDLDLPTYHEILQGAIRDDRRLDLLANTRDGDVNSLIASQHSLNSLRAKAILSQMMPTYQDLGIRVPIGGLPTDIARRLSDTVDPDFFYHTVRLLPDLENARKRADAHGLSVGLAPATRLDPARAAIQADGRAADDSAGALALSPAAMTAARTGAIGPLVPRANELRAVSLSPNVNRGAISKFGLTADASSQYFNHSKSKTEQPVKDLFSEDHQKLILEQTSRSRREDITRMVQAYPTFKFYFIETDSQQWALFDDFYGYNAILSFRLLRDKYIPDLLEMEILNVTGNLDRHRFLNQAGSLDREDHTSADPNQVSADQSEQERREDAANRTQQGHENPDLGRSDVDPVTLEKETLDHFFLENGTNVMLKMGYTSNPEELEIVFTGQIVELNAGDVIKIVCQSYKSELMVPLNAHHGGNDARLLDVAGYVMEKSPTEHFGQPHTLQFLAAMRGLKIGSSFFNPASEQLVDELTLGRVLPNRADFEDAASLFASYLKSGEDGKPPGKGAPGLVLPLRFSSSTLMDSLLDSDSLDWFLSGALGVDSAFEVYGAPTVKSTLARALTLSRRMGNIWLPNNFSSAELVGTSTRDWIIPNITGWEVLREMARHLPGYVVDVRTYDHQATLFFGRPEQPYYFTDAKQDEEADWQRLRPRIFRDHETALTTDLVDQFRFSRNHLLDYKGSIDRWAGISDKVVGLGVKGVPNATTPDAISIAALAPGALSHIKERLGSRGLKEVMEGFYSTFAPGFVDRFVGGGSGDAAIREGSVFVSLPDWEATVSQITSAPLNTDPSLLSRFLPYTDIPFYLGGISESDRIVFSDGKQVHLTEDMLARTSHVVSRSQFALQAFLVHFNAFLQSTTNSQAVEEAVNKLQAAANLQELFELNPRMRLFRDFHYVDSGHQIIANEIRATKEEMFNKVIVNWSEGSWGGTSSDETNGIVQIEPGSMQAFLPAAVSKFLDPQEIRVSWVVEPNAETAAQAWLCAISNLSHGLQLMYRGHLHLRGNERIKPYDVINIMDFYNGVQGPIEVQRCVHEFSFETGFSTTVTPHAVVIPNNSLDMSQQVAAGASNAFAALAGIAPDGSMVGVGADTVAATTLAAIVTIASGSTLAPIATVGLLLYSMYSVSARGLDALEAQTGHGFWGNLWGEGQYGSTALPVKFVPLTRNGYPWTAGLKGVPKDFFKYQLNTGWEDAELGAGVINRALERIRRGEDISRNN
jgi:hypothetical protein